MTLLFSRKFKLAGSRGDGRHAYAKGSGAFIRNRGQQLFWHPLSGAVRHGLSAGNGRPKKELPRLRAMPTARALSRRSPRLTCEASPIRTISRRPCIGTDLGWDRLPTSTNWRRPFADCGGSFRSRGFEMAGRRGRHAKALVSEQRMRWRIVLSLLFLLGSQTSVFAGNNDPWNVWRMKLKSQCPSQHVNWICDVCYDALLYNFEKTLPDSMRRMADSLADSASARRCAKEIAGFSCEMSESLDAYNKLGLMNRFVGFGCRHVRCSDIALCTTDYPE